jgi:predicted nicotinamide N-methyase
MSESLSSAEEDGNLYNLFVCEDYVEKTWRFGDVEQRLLCSNMSSTDHDLTGQIVWPACVLLSWFIYQNSDHFKGKKCLELGAGCGLAGFVAAKYAAQCTITDGNDIVCTLLARNKEHLAAPNVAIEKLLWGIRSELDRVFPNDSDWPDAIIGADVILWPNQISQLLHTIRWLLIKRPSTSTCFISYIVRANTTTDKLFSTAERLGLAVDSVPVESFVPADCREFDSLEKKLLKITITEGVDLERLLREEEQEVSAEAGLMDVLARPC